MLDGSSKAATGQVGQLDPVIFSGSLTKLRVAAHNNPEDVTQSSNIKYFSNNLGYETRKHMSYIFRSCILGKKHDLRITTRIKEKF